MWMRSSRFARVGAAGSPPPAAAGSSLRACRKAAVRRPQEQFCSAPREAERPSPCSGRSPRTCRRGAPNLRTSAQVNRDAACAPRHPGAQLARRCRHGVAAHRRRASRLAEDRDRDRCAAIGGAPVPDGAGGLHDGDVGWRGRVARTVRGQAERRDAGVRRIRCGAASAQLVSGRVGRVTCPDPGTMGVRSRFAGTAAHARGAASAVACAPVGVLPGAWRRSWAARRRSIRAARGARRGSSAGARTPH